MNIILACDVHQATMYNVCLKPSMCRQSWTYGGPAQACQDARGPFGNKRVNACAGYRWQLVRSSDKASPGQAPAHTSNVESGAGSGRDSEASLEASSSQHSRLHSGTAGEVERLRTALRQKEDQVASLQSQLTNLEATRDRYACMDFLQHVSDARHNIMTNALCYINFERVWATCMYLHLIWTAYSCKRQDSYRRTEIWRPSLDAIPC